MIEDFSLNNNSLKLLYANNKIIRTTANDTTGQMVINVKIRCFILLPLRPLTEAETEQVHKIMSACRLNPDEYLLISDKSKFMAWKDKDHIKEIIWMGLTPADWGLDVSLPAHTATTRASQTWIATFDIAELIHNKDAKSTLWKQALQPHFTT